MKATAHRAFLALLLVDCGHCGDPSPVPEDHFCKDATKCHGPAACGVPTCDGSLCGVSYDRPGTPCPGGVCDEHYMCVLCLTDGMKDADETDIDCGGAGCRRCVVGEACKKSSDCTTNLCGTNAKCVESNTSCISGAQDGKETGVDCGGPECEKRCGPGQGCNADSDCAGESPKKDGKCLDHHCCAAPCEGPCNTCTDGTGACRFTVKNTKTNQCASSGDTCDGAGHCTSCNDGAKNNDETGFDCGGKVCPPCGIAAPQDNPNCIDDADCKSRTCVAGRCSNAECDDGEKNHGETAVDCGGPCGSTCGLGATCSIKADCLSGNCEGGFCAP